MRPLVGYLRGGWRLTLSVHHILVQAAPGQQEAQPAGCVEAGHDDHGGLQALRIDLPTDLLQILAQLTDHGGVAAISVAAWRQREPM